MRKMISLIVIALMVMISLATANIHDYNEAGWISSTGELTADGLAGDVSYSEEEEAWSFNCSGEGVCFEIDGPHLMIWETAFSPSGDPVRITKL